MKTYECGIPIIACHSAEQMIAELNEIHSRWKDDTWIFRGHNHGNWLLVPSAMRESFRQQYVSCFPRRFSAEGIVDYARQKGWSLEKAERMNTTFVQNWAELEMVLAFETLADRVGLSIPNDRLSPMGQIPRDELRELRQAVCSQRLTPPEEPPSAVVTYQPTSLVVALAQHHRIPTRMLDWTFRPLVAAFFAAYRLDRREAEKTCVEMSDSMLVWAVNAQKLSLTSLELVTHRGRRSQIGYLFAQDGLFLYDKRANEKYVEEGHWQPFEMELKNLVRTESVYKLVLHSSMKDKLLDLLTRKRVTETYLMPSFDYAAKQIKRWRFEDWNKLLNVEGNDRL